MRFAEKISVLAGRTLDVIAVTRIPCARDLVRSIRLLRIDPAS